MFNRVSIPLSISLFLCAFLVIGCPKPPPPAPPTAAFSATPTSGEAPLEVAFSDESSPGTSAIRSWSWDFGDTGTSTDPSPVHTYAAAGSYTVSLTVATADGSDTETKNDYVVATEPSAEGEGEGEGAPPEAAFSADVTSGSSPLDVQFSDESTCSAGSITSWLWDFGDGHTSTEQSPAHTYQTPGPFTVSLTVANAAGDDTAIQYDYILVWGISPVQGAPGTPVRITGPDFSTTDAMDISVCFGTTCLPPAEASENVVTTAVPIADAGPVTVRVDIAETNVVDGLAFDILAPPPLDEPAGAVAAEAQNDFAGIAATVGVFVDLFGETLAAKDQAALEETLSVVDMQVAAIGNLLDNATEAEKQHVDQLLETSGLADELADIRADAEKRMRKCAELDIAEVALWQKRGYLPKAWTIPARYRFVGDWLAGRLHHAMEYANVALLGLNAFAAAGGGGAMSGGLAILDVGAAFLNLVYSVIEALPMQLEQGSMTGQVGENNVIATESFGEVVFRGTFKPEVTVEQFLFGLFFPKFADKLGLGSLITDPITAYGGDLIGYADDGIVLRPVPPESNVPIYTYDFVGDPVSAPNPPQFGGFGLADLIVDESIIVTGEQEGGPFRLFAQQKVFEFKGSFWDPNNRPHVEHYFEKEDVSVTIEKGAEIEVDEPADGTETDANSITVDGTCTNVDGSAAVGATITITVQAGGGAKAQPGAYETYSTETDASGRFSLEVALFSGRNVIEVATVVQGVTTTRRITVLSRAMPATYCVATCVNNDALGLVDPALAADFMLIESGDLGVELDAPRAAVFLPDGETLIVLNSPRDAAPYLLAVRLRALDDIAAIAPPLTLGGGVPDCVALTPDAQTVLVSTLDGASELYLVDVREPSNLRLADTVDCSAYDPYGAESVAAGIADDGRVVAVVTLGEWDAGGPSDALLVDVTNPYDAKVVTTIEVGSRGGEVAIIPDEPLAFVSGISWFYGGISADAAMDIIDFSDPDHPLIRSALDRASTFAMGSAMMPSGDVALLSDPANNHLIFLDVSNPDAVAEMTDISPLWYPGEGGISVAVSPSADYAALTNNVSNTAVLFDLSDMNAPAATLVTPTETWNWPVGIAFRP